ncbi:hypothetical protein CKJ54_24750 (plasmid) [Mycobacterium marseillense]|uniref:Uncharacterized protein n=1 Tax=Mycobacterium marseillense TaxID=701042 RepID=A0AAD0E3Z3_9MYCO|nr:hypothetical protein CKJ54_24750 [Mycobacterium marseillense]
MAVRTRETQRNGDRWLQQPDQSDPDHRRPSRHSTGLTFASGHSEPCHRTEVGRRAEYRRILDGRNRGFHPDEYLLSMDELEEIAAARVHRRTRGSSAPRLPDMTQRCCWPKVRSGAASL